MTAPDRTGPLKGLRVFDLTRILAGPTCTQLLGDLGAEIIKIERPGHGDDTRKWGPPFLKDENGEDSDTAAYYLSANRNKRSLTLDIATPEGQALAKRLIAHCDVLVENFKVGGLAKFSLDYASIAEVKPDIVYCSITGFGQTGPYAPRAGYDYLAQGMGGIMSLTGESEGEPMKVGVGIADVVCGLFAANAIQAALRHRDLTGEGQHLDLALLDTQIAWLVNEGMNYLVSGQVPRRLGNEHPNIVPYKVLPCSNGYFILAVGNDAQFQRFCEFAGVPELAEDERFKTNASRVRNRDALYALLPDVTVKKPLDNWIEGLAEIGVPSGPVNDLARVFDDPHVLHRGMRMKMPYPSSEAGELEMMGNPIKFSRTPVDYKLPPPKIGEHTDDVLTEMLDLSEEEIAALRAQGTI